MYGGCERPVLLTSKTIERDNASPRANDKVAGSFFSTLCFVAIVANWL